MTVRNRGGTVASKQRGENGSTMNNNNDNGQSNNITLAVKRQQHKKKVFLPNTAVTLMKLMLCFLLLMGISFVFPRTQREQQRQHEDDKSSSSLTNKQLRVRTIASKTVSDAATTIKSMMMTTNQKTRKQQRPTRFPRYGTQEFAKQCNWTIPSPDLPEPTCAYLARPPIRSHEGISDWSSHIVTTYIMARQVGCKIFVDYGENVDIHKVIQPIPNIHPLHNWSTPSWVTCDKGCQNTLRSLHGWNKTIHGRFHNVNGPQYRYSMGGLATHPLYKDDFSYLTETLPGFQLQTGMACVMGNIFRDLASTATDFEPKLFTDLLPALRDEETVVITLYVRTNRADGMAISEMKNETMAQEKKITEDDFLKSHASIARCLEDEYLKGHREQPELSTLSRFVWMVISDSQETKRHATEVYSSANVNTAIPIDSQQWKNKVIPREVLHTSSRGVHTRPERHPGTRDFAEGFIDWFLIGESDAVIVERISSFGPTGAMRTNRPMFRTTGHGNCNEPISVLRDPSERPNKK